MLPHLRHYADELDESNFRTNVEFNNSQCLHSLYLACLGMQR
jgi:hypothetical protein